MAFGGLTGLGPEAIQRLMANPSGIPFGALNFHPSQMGNLMGGPAFPQQFGPTPAMQAMAPSWGPGQIPMSVNSPYLPPMRGGGGTAQAAAPALSRSNVAAQRVFDALRGTAGTEAIPMGSGAQILPNTRALTPPGAGGLTGPMSSPPAWNDFFEMRGRNGVAPMRPAGAPAFPIDPIQYAEGATSRYPAGASSAFPRAVNPTVNGPGAYPTPAATGASIPGRGVGPALPQRVPGATLGGSGTGAVTNAAVNQVDDAVRMSAMQMPRPPIANPIAALGESVSPVAIRGATSSPATQTLMQRLLPTLTGGAEGAAGTGLLARGRNFATGPGMLRGIGRGVVGGVADNLVGQPLAEQIGEVNGVAGDFASGFSTGAGYGFGFGPAGALVGGLGVGIGNTLTGGGVTDLLNPEAPSALEQAMSQVEASGDPMSAQFNNVMGKFALNDSTVWDDLGITDQSVRDGLIEEFNRLAPEMDQEGRTQLLQTMTSNALAASQGIDPATGQPIGQTQGQSTGLDPQSILALQAQAAGLMAPIAADSVAIGDMGQTALSRLAQGLPPELAQSVMAMGDAHQQSGQNSANMFMQQAYSAPQLAALGQQNAMTQQIAQQLQQQAIQSLPQFAQTSGGGSFEDLLAGQALGGGDTSGVQGDIMAMLQAAG